MIDAPVSGKPDELAAVAAEVLGDPPPSPAAEAPPGPPAAADELAADVEALAEEVIAKPERLTELGEEEIAALVELGFGLAAEWRGPHWEIEERASRRIAKWVRRSIERHGGLPDWLAKYFPDLMALGLVSYEVLRRVREDRALARKKSEAV